jgi:acylphosphatase
MSEAIRQVTIRGRVQGVGYRAWVADTARRLGLDGWVRNRRDGSVEAVFAGSLHAVTGLVVQCQSGPAMARVDAVVEEPGNADALKLRASGERFSVLPTL